LESLLKMEKREDSVWCGSFECARICKALSSHPLVLFVLMQLLLLPFTVAGDTQSIVQSSEIDAGSLGFWGGYLRRKIMQAL